VEAVPVGEYLRRDVDGSGRALAESGVARTDTAKRFRSIPEWLASVASIPRPQKTTHDAPLTSTARPAILLPAHVWPPPAFNRMHRR
jgi:hypothetical protein